MDRDDRAARPDLLRGNSALTRNPEEDARCGNDELALDAVIGGFADVDVAQIRQGDGLGSEPGLDGRENPVEAVREAASVHQEPMVVAYRASSVRRAATARCVAPDRSP